MYKQVSNIYIYHNASVCIFIYAYMLLYLCTYEYIGVFWLAFGLVLYQGGVEAARMTKTT